MVTWEMEAIRVALTLRDVVRRRLVDVMAEGGFGFPQQKITLRFRH